MQASTKPVATPIGQSAMRRSRSLGDAVQDEEAKAMDARRERANCHETAEKQILHQMRGRTPTLKRRFAKLDASGGGLLDAQELKSALDGLSISVAPEQVSEWAVRSCPASPAWDPAPTARVRPCVHACLHAVLRARANRSTPSRAPRRILALTSTPAPYLPGGSPRPQVQRRRGARSVRLSQAGART